ncbi:MAG: hypothetical protein OXR68_05420 [Alphaproteobacteria bacterium]|nr:hypothetical protein [Alphaproteobacteria bacterium]MDD9920043.1 hypothetical protein [Alphaproteobacteria bacterium]
MTRRNNPLWLAGIAVFSGLAPFSASATIPATAELQRLHDVMTAPSIPTQVPDKIVPILPEAASIKGINDTQAETTYFTLNSLEIDGVTLYKPAKFLPIFKYDTGQRINVKRLYELVNQITTTYRNDGYILARAIVPPQDITAGHVKITVLEGYLNQVIVEGSGTDSKLIRAYADKLKGTPLHNDQLERYLLLMNDLPGIKATSTLKPASVSGASNLIIKVEETKYSGSYGINNWGTRYVGPNQLEGEVTANNLYATKQFGWHDKTRIRGVQSTDFTALRYLDLKHILPIFTEGTELDINVHQSISQPGYDLEQLNLDSSTSGMSFEIRHPLKRSRRENLDWFAMFDWRDTTTNTAGTKLSSDHIRAFRTGLNWDQTDSSGISNINVELSNGIGMFGASKKGDQQLSRTRGTGSGYTRLKAELSRLQRLNKSWNFMVAATGQHATHSLLAGEEFGIGGENYGRGYDTSEITGDSGFAAKAELQINFPVGWQHLDSWQLFGFYDVGVAYQRDREGSETNKPSTLASHGFGIRSKLGDSLSLDITLAKPGTRGVTSAGGSKNPNLYVRMKNRF